MFKTTKEIIEDAWKRGCFHVEYVDKLWRIKFEDETFIYEDEPIQFRKLLGVPNLDFLRYKWISEKDYNEFKAKYGE